MALYVMTGGRIWVGAREISSDVSRMSIPFDAEVKPTTNMASQGWKEGLCGTAQGQWEGDGFEDPGDIAEYLHGLFSSGALVPVSATAQYAIPAGTEVWTGYAMNQNRMKGGAVGDVAPDKFMFQISGKPYRGVVMAAGTIAATGTTASYTGGAVGGTQSAYLFLHVSSGTGQFDVAIETDADNTFASATSRGAFAQVTEPDWKALTVAGAVTDTEWRASITVGSGGPFTYAIILAIQ